MEKSVLIARLEELRSWLDERAAVRFKAIETLPELPTWIVSSYRAEATRFASRAAAVEAALELIKEKE